MSVRLVTDLPEPDSPTMAVVLPARMLKLTSATERISPSSVSKEVLKLRTSRRFMVSASHRFPEARVQQIADAVAQQLQR